MQEHYLQKAKKLDPSVFFFSLAAGPWRLTTYALAHSHSHSHVLTPHKICELAFSHYLALLVCEY